MRLTALDRKPARRRIVQVCVIVTAVVLWAGGLSGKFTAASAGPDPAAALCGNGAPPDYGFSYDLQQEHWTVNWRNYVSQQSVTEVDAVLDRLNEDSIAQAMILFQAQDQVGIRVNCAVHFLRYMRLGLPSGERKDNGFVFLIVVEPDRIDIHYGVGLGLPALTAPELTTINRDAEAAYQSSGSMDQALLTLAREFDAVSRNKYPPLIAPAPTPGITNLPLTATGPVGLLALCCLLCIGIFLLAFLIWAFTRLVRAGMNFEPYGSDSFGSGFPLDGGGGPWMRGGGGGGPWSGGGGSSGPSTRGGSGSGRSGRGN